MAILGIFKHLCKKLMKWEYLLKEDKIIQTFTVQIFFNALFLKLWFSKNCYPQIGCKIDIHVLVPRMARMGSFDVLYTIKATWKLEYLQLTITDPKHRHTKST